MIPKSPPLSAGGIFRICASSDDEIEKKTMARDHATIVLWDRKIEGRFPESKEVKQLVRDLVNPNKDLGHSDKKDLPTAIKNEIAEGKEVDCIECQQQRDQLYPPKPSAPDEQQQVQPTQLERLLNIDPAFYKYSHISIEYSTGVAMSPPGNGLYRATWYANELLSMVYERNAWWKKQQQQQQQQQAFEGERGVPTNDGSQLKEVVPAAVECVTLMPNRMESDVLVRLRSMFDF